MSLTQHDAQLHLQFLSTRPAACQHPRLPLHVWTLCRAVLCCAVGPVRHHQRHRGHPHHDQLCSNCVAGEGRRYSLWGATASGKLQPLTLQPLGNYDLWGAIVSEELRL